MKKIKTLLSSLLLGFIVCGCGCSKVEVDTYANVSNSDEVLNNSKGDKLTVGKVYDYIRQNNDESISKNLMKMIMKSELDFSNQDIEDLYKEYLNKEFKNLFIDSGSYNYDGKFDEQLLVKYLKSESYEITCPVQNNNNDDDDQLLDTNYFTCDYSDYIEKELDYDIYLKMLKIQYIINEKSNLIDKSGGRIIEYYSASRGSSSDVETRAKLEEYVKSIEENYNSSSEDVVKSLKDIGELKRKEDLKKIVDEVDNISTSKDSDFKMLSKYTTCGDKKCTIEEGKVYQQNLIMEKEYYYNKVVTKTDTSILFEGARNVLFGANLDDYLYEIGNDKYLMSPAYENNGIKNINDIIIFDGSSNYYIVKVKVVDGSDNTSFDDKVLVAELLLDKITERNVFDYYFDEVEIEIFDKQIREYFISKYGEY